MRTQVDDDGKGKGEKQNRRGNVAGLSGFAVDLDT